MSYNQRVCKFFLKGNCMYGTSCRFLHSNQTNDHYYDDYHSRSDRNTGSYYNSQQSRRHGNNYYDENEEYESSNRHNYQSNNQNNYSNSRKNHGLKNDFGKNYNRNKEYDSHDEFAEYPTENITQHHNSRKNVGSNNYYKDENQGSYSVANRNSNSRYSDTKYDQSLAQLKNYSSEINNYQAHMKQLLASNIWPLSCSQPIGHTFPIQPIGILNLIEVSFEEIRCDYYFAKSLNSDALSIHKQLYEKLLLKARRQKESIIISEEKVLNDMLATFEKCNAILNNPAFHNSIQPDTNSYWDMTIKYLSSSEVNQIFKIENGQGFNNNVPNEPKKKINNKPQIQILMQTETYGKMDCNEFVQEEFTDFIPIMPPPKKYCP